MNKKIVLSCIISTSLGYSVSTAHGQTDFDNWNDLGGFDAPKTDVAPKLSIPDPKEQQRAAEVQNKIDKDLKVETPKDIPIVNIPIPATPEISIETGSSSTSSQAAPVVVEKPVAKKNKESKESTQTTKKTRIKPVEIKDYSAKKAAVPQKRMTEDTSLSRVFEDHQELERTYKPDGIQTRHDFETKVVPPKFFQKAEFDDNNKHLPTVVYQKRYSELLFAAIQKDDVGAINTLLSNGADINSKFAENGYTALMYAIQTKNLRTVRYLITKGANLNLQGNDGKTALHLAAASHDVEIFSTMIKSGAKPSVADYVGKVPLDYVSGTHKGQFETIVAQIEPDKNNMLFLFVEKGSIKPVSQLIEQGVDVNIRDKNGDTPLMIAVRKNDSTMVNLLLNKGASTIVMNNTGEHALGIAQKNNNIELAKVIDTVSIKRELESGVSRRISQPAVQVKTEIQATPLITEVKLDEPKKLEDVQSVQNSIETIVEKQGEPKTLIIEIDSPEEANEAIQTVVEEAPQQKENKSFFSIFSKRTSKKEEAQAPKKESSDGFFASMGKSLNSISERISGKKPSVQASIPSSDIVTEKLPDITSTSNSESQPMLEVYNIKKTKLPSNIVKKTLIDGQEAVHEEAGKSLMPSASENIMQPMSIIPKGLGN